MRCVWWSLDPVEGSEPMGSDHSWVIRRDWVTWALPVTVSLHQHSGNYEGSQTSDVNFGAIASLHDSSDDQPIGPELSVH